MEPAPTAVTTPVFKSTVATAALELVQVPPKTVELIFAVVPLHKDESVAVTIPAIGAAVTERSIVADEFEPTQLPVPTTV